MVIEFAGLSLTHQDKNMISLPRMGLLAAALFITGCSEPIPPPSAIEQLADEYLDGLMEADALMGTYYSIEGARHDRLPDNSLAGTPSGNQKKMPGLPG
jgi:hypothetical protein